MMHRTWPPGGGDTTRGGSPTPDHGEEQQQDDHPEEGQPLVLADLVSYDGCQQVSVDCWVAARLASPLERPWRSQ